MLEVLGGVGCDHNALETCIKVSKKQIKDPTMCCAVSFVILSDQSRGPLPKACWMAALKGL